MLPPPRYSLPLGVALLLTAALAIPGTAAITTDTPAASAVARGTDDVGLLGPDRLSVLATPPVTPAPRVPAAGTEAALPVTVVPEPAAPEPAAPEPAAPAPTAAPVRAAAPTTASRSVARSAAAAPTTVRPNDGRVSSGFGPRWGTQHSGLDLAGGYGSTIRSAQAGTVTFAGSASGYGNLVVVRHDGGFSTAYGHMSVITVSAGEQVDAGEQIAEVGREGRSTGPHLHFEVRVGEDKIDPAGWLRSRGVRV